MIFNLKNTDFFRNLIAMMKGTSIAQFILLLSYPLITRIFTPIEIGIAGTYISIALVISVLSTLRYEVAIVLPKSEKIATNILVISLINVIVITILTIPASLILGSYLANYFNKPLIEEWLFLLPISVFFFGIYNTLTYWNNRIKRFELLGNSRIVHNGASGSFKIIAGSTFGASSGFLIIGDIFGQFLTVLFLVRDFLKNGSLKDLSSKNVSFKSLLETYIEYRNFPLFSLPMGIINQFSLDMLVYILNIIFNTATVGFYILAHRVITFPLNFVSFAFSSVFFQKLNVTNNRKRIYLYSMFGNLLLGLVVLSPIFFLGGEIFAFVFGDEWFKAGIIARILTPLLIVRFAVSSVSSVYAVKKRNELSFIWQIAFLLSLLSIAFLFEYPSIEDLLFVYSSVGSILYFSLGLIGYLLIKDE